jgi:hypothetical protein
MEARPKDFGQEGEFDTCIKSLQFETTIWPTL